MRICVVTETYWPEVNGVAMTLHRLVTGLANNGHNIQLICPRRKERDLSQLSPNVTYHGVKGFPIPRYKEANFGLPSRKLLSDLWNEQRPDVIYVATEGPLGWSAVKEANCQNIPVTSGFHTNFHSYSQHYNIGFLKNTVTRYLVKLHNNTNTTIVPSEDQKQHLLSMGIDNVSLLGRGVDTQLFTPDKRSTALRKEWNVNNTDPVLLYVGRIAAEKNLDLAIRTYFVLHSMNKRLKFVLVGDGPLTKSLKNNHPEFIFAGMQTGEDLAKHYASGDLFVFPSLTETFGNVILEAMASGLGIITYDYAASHMHIRSKYNGILAAKDNPQLFISNAKELLSNKLLLEKCRVNAYNYAKTQGWDAIVNRFESILESTMDSRCLTLDLAS